MRKLIGESLRRRLHDACRSTAYLCTQIPHDCRMSPVPDELLQLVDDFPLHRKLISACAGDICGGGPALRITDERFPGDTFGSESVPLFERTDMPVLPPRSQDDEAVLPAENLLHGRDRFDVVPLIDILLAGEREGTPLGQVFAEKTVVLGVPVNVVRLECSVLHESEHIARNQPPLHRPGNLRHIDGAEAALPMNRFLARILMCFH